KCGAMSDCDFIKTPKVCIPIVSHQTMNQIYCQYTLPALRRVKLRMYRSIVCVIAMWLLELKKDTTVNTSKDN
ncbi:MAG: hypothetical protein KAR43_00180, partial [Deltaproteobacteria bacterium]|nr:hypothetical protein [Deltaproteobacteria bacterium]